MFVVPLETRGAMIQARVVHEWCRRNDHRVVRVLGTRFENLSPYPRSFPGFDAPGLVVGGMGAPTRIDRHPSLTAWIRQCLGSRRSISAAMANLDRAIAEDHADAIVSFMEPMAALHRRIGHSRSPLLTIGTALRFGHPEYRAEPSLIHLTRALGRRGRWCSLGGLRYALSLEPMRPIPASGLLVGPPLVEVPSAPQAASDRGRESGRGWIVQLARPEQRQEVEFWHHRHPEIAIDCFYERSESVGSEEVDATLRFHPLNRDLFRERSTDCDGIVLDAGFESLAQAAASGRPMVQWLSRPHPEALIHAHELARLGLSQLTRRFHPQPPDGATPPGFHRYREWISKSESCLAQAFALLESRARSRRVS